MIVAAVAMILAVVQWSGGGALSGQRFAPRRTARRKRIVPSDAMSNMVVLLVLLPLAGAIAVLLCGSAPATRTRDGRGMRRRYLGGGSVDGRSLRSPDSPITRRRIVLPFAGLAGRWDQRLVVGVDGAVDACRCVHHEPAGLSAHRFVFALVLLLEASMMGVFAAGNILGMFVCWEISRVALFFLTGGWGGTDRRQAAMKFFLFTLVGSGLTFVGCGLLVLSHHWMSDGVEFTLNLRRLIEELPQLAAASSENARYWAGVRPWLFAAIGLGFAIHVPLFPLHIWLQDAAVEAPTAGMLLLCGVWLKIGAFGWCRLLLPMFPELCRDLSGYFLWPAAIGTVYGVMLALVQDDLKRLAANLTVSFASFSVLGLFSMTATGIDGGLLSMCSHGLSLGILICVTGALFERYRTRDAEAFGGLAGRFPRLAGVTFVAVASLIAMPPTSGFIATVLVLLGVAQVHPGFVVTALTAVVLSTWCFARVMQRVFWGTFREPVIDHPSWKPKHEIDNSPQGDLSVRELAAVVPLILAIVCLGLVPQAFVGHTEAAVARIVEFSDQPPAPSQFADGDESDR